MKEDKKDKEKKSKQRFLSPSFRRGGMKESSNKPKEDDDDGEFRINLFAAGGEEEEENESKSPSPVKHRGKRSSKAEQPTEIKTNMAPIKEKEHHHHHDKNDGEVSESMKTHPIPGGHIKKIAYASQAGKTEDQQTKVNQDSLLVLQNVNGLEDFNIFCVLDGHGQIGHIVSNFVARYFTAFFKKNKKMNAQTSEDAVYKRLRKNNYDILKRSANHAERDLKKSEIDASFSGTTCVMVLQVGEKIVVSNIGDSRAIIVKGDNVTPLTVDQKPDDPAEKKRINESGGEVDQYEEDGEKSGPFRVWKKGEMYPGIAMSRSIGDFTATTLGVISDPVFSENIIDSKTNFIIVASDGVWEFLSNERVAEIVKPFYKKMDPEGACRALIKESTEWWNKEDIVVDDITCIAVFF